MTPRDWPARPRRHRRKRPYCSTAARCGSGMKSNGWTYPIHPPAAKGLAGLQQFFETLGLAKPPHVVLSTSRIQLFGRPGEALRIPIRIEAVERKYVFAQARSTVSWLKSPRQPRAASGHNIPAQVPQVPHYRASSCTVSFM